MTKTVDAQLAAIEVQIDLLLIQVQALRHALTEPPKATIALPAHCVDVEARGDRCGLRDEDARLDRSNFTDPQAWNCRGCGFEHRTGTNAEGVN